MAWENINIEVAAGTCNNDTLWQNGYYGFNLPSPPSGTTFNGTYRESAGEWWVVGDSTLGIKGTATLSPYGDTYNFKLYKNGSAVSNADITYTCYTYDQRGQISFYFGVNEETQKGTFFAVAKMDTYYNGYSGDINGFTNDSDVYTLLKNAVPVLYTWTSVPAISGKMGILSISAIKDENIGDGNTIYGQPLEYIKTLAAGSRIETIATNLTKNEQKTIIYSGNFYRMDILRSVVSWPTTGGYVDMSTAVLKFYLNPTTGGVENLILTYSVPFGVDANGNQVMANYLGIIIDDEQEVAALAIIRPGDSEVAYNFPGVSNMTAEEMHNLWIWVRAGWNPDEEEEPIDSFTDNEGNGGGDLINRPHNPIPEPGVPGLSAYDTGFVSQYVIGKTALKSLASFLWSASFVENVQKFFNDPRQIIQGIVISDVLPGDTTANVLIKAGGISTGVYGAKVNKQFERYDMGKLTIDKRLKTNDDKGGIYFDYSPYTRLKLYLPYCGEHELNPDDCIGKTLKLSYTVDHLSGICCAHLTIVGSEDECHYNYTGQLGVQVPLSAEDYGGFYRAVLSAGAALGGALATAATGGMTAPLAVGASANAISNIANMGKEVDYTSGGGSISGQLSSEYPYITIEEPDPFMSVNQPHYTGYPCYSTYKLGVMSGYTKVYSIHLDGLSCTEIERNAIRDQLSKGVIIQQGDELPAPDPTRPEGEESLILLHNLSDVDTIGKKFEKDNQGHVEYIELTSKLLYNQDFAAVGLLVSEYNAGYNYAYIPSFGRVYYIDKITAESGAMVRYDLSCDAAESFWSELKECEAIIETTEDIGKSKLLVNNNTWFMPQKKNVKTLTFKDNMGEAAHFSRKPVADGGKMCFLITIAGDTDDPTP